MSAPYLRFPSRPVTRSPFGRHGRCGLFLAFSGVLALAGVFAAPGVSAAPPVADLDSFTGQLDREQQGWLATAQVPGAAVALVRDGQLAWAGGYGQADPARQVPVTADTVFQVGSISKPVTAWGVLRLVDKGLLDLDAPVETYLTRWHLPTSNYDADGVTIRRLLTHSAGLSQHGYPGLSPTQPLPPLEFSLSGVRIVRGARLAIPVFRRRLHRSPVGHRGGHRRTLRRLHATRGVGPAGDDPQQLRVAR